MSGSGQKLYKLEALRGLAAFYVVLHHALPHKYLVGGFNAYNVFRFGQEAVILFFLLSGFVIKYSYASSSDKSFRQYFLKRFLRIYVPLISVFGVSYLILSQAEGSLINPNLGQMFGNLFMLQDWAKVKPHVIVDPYLANNPLWSLSYEWWFYMLFFPITTLLKSDESQHRVVFAVCVLAAICYLMYPIFPLRIIMYFSIWWTGVVLADRYIKNGKIHLSDLKLPIVTLSAITGLMTINVILAKSGGQRILFGMHPVLEGRHFLFALLAVFVAVLWRNSGWPLFDRIFKPFALLAPISYTMYIIHLPIMTQATFLDWINIPVVTWFAYFALMLIFSYIIELVIYPRVRRVAMARFQKTAPTNT